MNHSQQATENTRPDDDTALTEFLASLMDYIPTIPDEMVEYYLARSGFQCPDVPLIRLVAVATQKFVAEVANDALQHCKPTQASIIKDKRDKQPKDKRLILTMDDLSAALHELNLVLEPEVELDAQRRGEDVKVFDKMGGGTRSSIGYAKERLDVKVLIKLEDLPDFEAVWEVVVQIENQFLDFH